MFDDSIYKKTGRVISETSNDIAQKFAGNWDDKVHASFQNYIRFCSQQCYEIEGIIKDISGVYNELNDLRAESVITEAESCYNNTEMRNG
jgi:hypothetical protein